MNRTFGHLVGTPEFERFLKVYRALVQSPGYKQHSANLCSEYMRLIESAQTRLTTQLKERLRSLAKESSTQLSAKSGFSESDPMNIVIRQDPGSAKMAQSEGDSLTIEEPQVILTWPRKRKRP